MELCSERRINGCGSWMLERVEEGGKREREKWEGRGGGCGDG